ncbi:hypothetical protein L6R50_08850 [Myxococcota bacterium]|nr:hypothetical protein [Myxococcota bacterium]
MAGANKGVLFLGGAGAVGFLLLAAAAGRRREGDGSAAPAPAVPEAGRGPLETAASVPGRVADAVTDAVRDAGGALVDRMSWVSRVIARVSHHEGGYDAVNPNKDGAGLSFGILQWNRATLAKLLAQMYADDPEAFRRLFGPSWAVLLQAANSGGMGTVDGAHLWREPWLSRFRAAGRHPPFQRVQDRMAREGEHFRAAEKVAQRLGVPTERALALFFDTAVQQGATAADQVAGKVKAAFVSGGAAVTVPYRDLLATYAQAAADRARRTTPPSESSSGRLRWVKVGAEWHLHAGNLDLYRNILGRRTAILNDRALGDVAVELA